VCSSDLLRLLDCKEEKCVEIKQGAPQMIDYLCEECKNHFKEVLEILDSSGVPYYLDHHLVRGLDYYTRTAFEFFAAEPVAAPEEKKPVEPEKPAELKIEEVAVHAHGPHGAPVQEEEVEKTEEEAEKEEEEHQRQQEEAEGLEKGRRMELGGGGRYDLLAEAIGGKNISGVGGALGVDRILETNPELQRSVPLKNPKVFFIQLGSEAKRKSLSVLEMLRKAKIPTNHSLSKDSLKSQLKMASRMKVGYALIFGQKEALENSIIVRDMDSASQEIIPVPEVANYLKNKLRLI